MEPVPVSTPLLRSTAPTLSGCKSPNSIGHAVTEYIATNSQGNIAAGTHGRGIYKGILQGDQVNTPMLTANPTSARPGTSVTLQSINFDFSSDESQVDVDFNGVSAEIINLSAQEMEVEVPRGTVPPGRSSNVVQISVTSSGTTVSTSFRILPPEAFEVLPNYPNPFNPTTTIPFDLPVESGIILQVYDMSGRKVLEPVRRVFQPNSYNLQVDMGGLASGVYFYRVVAIPQDGSGEPNIKSGKMTLIK
ncbi:MAG: T9SS type A sorting domain-containing protein [Balneolaceae bacterium]|nr:T9SS type A sorting domain-containing protein [Balneolaceae bacterium]